jgi:hypothetical protein
MKTKLLFVSILLFASSFTLFGQDRNQLDSIAKGKYMNSIGLGAGFTTGFGLSYRYTLRKNGFQVNFFPYFTNYGKNATISVGLTFLHKLTSSRKVDLYMYFANDYFYHKSDTLYNNNNGNIKLDREKWNTGLGLGFEWDTEKKIVIDIMGGYGQFNSFERLSFTAEVAVYYRF